MTSAGISVIIPHLNQPDYLRRCLQSLEAQNFELSNVEIIVVDNGSHELPTEICASFKNVKLMSEAKQIGRAHV